jgi:hypothetical protein
MEALQTDVMRFIAILGLCLAAIFSLVNGAQQEQRETPQRQEQIEVHHTVAEPPEAEPREVPVVEVPEPQAVEVAVAEVPEPQPAEVAAAPVQTPAPNDSPERPPETPEPPPREKKSEVRGFTLEFESGAALQRSLASGEIELFASNAEQFWVYRRDGVFQAAEAPARYYQMHPATVPVQLRSLAVGVTTSDSLQWGVTLPARTAQEIQQLISGRAGGSLLIGADIGVRLE